MKFSTITINFCLLSVFLQADHNYNEIIIPSVNIENPYWEFAYQPIRQVSDEAFAELIEKWEFIIQTQWQRVNELVYEEINMDADRLSCYRDHPNFVNFYMTYYMHWYPDFFDEQNPQDIDPIVLNFFHLKLYYLGCSKLTQFNKMNKMPMMTTSFGLDSKHHYLIFNDNVYNQEHLEDLYLATAQKVIKYKTFESTNVYESRIVEDANLLHLGITLSLSNIIHQSDLFIKLLYFLTFAEQSVSDELQKHCSSYLLFLCYIESALQSKNPVEIALYLQPQLDNMPYVFSLLWQEFIDDLKNCYDSDDLAAYEKFSQEERRATLYQNHSNE